ncbi:hypothetical protein [Streptomyces sp. NPDC014006]|uniref:hypothetical protein n=1 Tax=Streptomyces sp. NPDC014006 TaxID=3364870 RepID=UPI0036F935B8
MFEIRAICDPADADRVTAALSTAFTTGSVRRHPTRDGQRVRLYITADHRSAAQAWPTPEQAYAIAPSILDEIDWTVQTISHTPCHVPLDREFWLRKAALLDRIALAKSPDGLSDVDQDAKEAASRLMEEDDPPVICDPRTYVRQQYAHWAQHH